MDGPVEQHTCTGTEHGRRTDRGDFVVQGNSIHTRTGAEDGRKTDGAEYERVVLISTNSILISQDTMCIHIHVLFHVTDVVCIVPSP